MRLTDLVTPLKPLEAMAQGRLVVASDVGGHQELIQDGKTGMLFAANDLDALASKVLQLLSTQELWPRLRAQARSFVEKQRSWPISVARYRSVYGRAGSQATMKAWLVHRTCRAVASTFGRYGNHTLQLAKLLREENIAVELIQVNRPYSHPDWIGRFRGIRAAFRAWQHRIPRLFAVPVGRVQLFHVMANSGWSWHLFAAPAIWVARIRGKPVIINYRGGEADSFFNKSFHG